MGRGLVTPVCCTRRPGGKKEQACTRPQSHTTIFAVITENTNHTHTHKPFTSTSHLFHLHGHNHTVHMFVANLPSHLLVRRVSFGDSSVCSVTGRHVFLMRTPFPDKTPYTDTYHVRLQKQLMQQNFVDVSLCLLLKMITKGHPDSRGALRLK